MKIAKLSLAAIIATTALTTVASAAPLEDLIKNTEINGYMRWRYTYLTEKNAPGYMLDDSNKYPFDDNRPILPPNSKLHSDKKGKVSAAVNGFRSIIDLTFGIDDHFYAGLGTEVEWDDDAKFNPTFSHENGEHIYGVRKGNADMDQTFQIRKMFLGFKNGGTDIRVGRQPIGSFFTDDSVGDGIKVINKDIEGMTLIGAAYNNINRDGDISTLALGKVGGTWSPDENGTMINEGGKDTSQHNIYVLGAVGKYEPMNFQLWSTVVEDVASLFAVDVSRDFELGEDAGFSLHGQFANSSLASKFKDGVYDIPYLKTTDKNGKLTNVGAGDTNWWAFETGFDAYGFDATVGYIGYKVNGGKIGMVSYEDNGGLIAPGEDLFNWALIMGKANYVFTSAGYSFLDEKVRVGGDYSYGKLKFNDYNYHQWEAVARIDYEYSKKLAFKTFYSWLNNPLVNGAQSPKYKSQKYRFEAKYMF